MTPDLYYPQPVRGQWWHYCVALRTKRGREFGVQATRFQFMKDGAVQRFCNCAVTDVQHQRHLRLEDYPEPGKLPESVITRIGHGWSGTHKVLFTVEGVPVNLEFHPVAMPFNYPSETSTHYGHPRMEVFGTIGTDDVTGVGCFDREIFEKLLKPGETGWYWGVAWFNDGTTRMFYEMEAKKRRVRIKAEDLDFKSLCPWQYWPVTKDRAFGYQEEFCWMEDNDGNDIGRGYFENVGHNGTPDL